MIRIKDSIYCIDEIQKIVPEKTSTEFRIAVTLSNGAVDYIRFSNVEERNEELEIIYKFFEVNR